MLDLVLRSVRNDESMSLKTHSFVDKILDHILGWHYCGLACMVQGHRLANLEVEFGYLIFHQK